MILVSLRSSSSAAAAAVAARRSITAAGSLLRRRQRQSSSCSCTSTSSKRFITIRHRYHHQQHLRPSYPLAGKFKASNDASTVATSVSSFSSSSSSPSSASSEDRLYDDHEGISATTTEQELPSCSQPLGTPLPYDEHACSVSLPTWSSVVGYEEGDIRVTNELRCGYPRFVYHPYVLQLMDAIIEKYGNPGDGGEQDCLLLPTASAAIRCRNFLLQAIENTKTTTDNALLENVTDEDLLQQHEHDEKFTSRIRAVVVCPSSSKTDDSSDTGSTGNGIYAVLFPAETSSGIEAKAYWQHTGEIVSSRRAEICLTQYMNIPIDKRVTCNVNPHVLSSCLPSSSENDIDNSSENNYDNNGNVHSVLRDRIADLARVPSKDYVALVPSGMSSMYTCLRSSRRYKMQQHHQQQKDGGGGGGTSIVFGFPYLDTLKLCSRREFCPDGTEFFGFGNDDDLMYLEQMLEKSTGGGGGNKSYCALFTEVPSNPLLQCPDLYQLRELADKYDFCLIVDDTISNFCNVDLIQTKLADAVCSSLTKLVSGRGDVIGGSVVFNPYTVKGQWMQKDYFKNYNGITTYTGSRSGLHNADAAALLRNSKDFVKRNSIINSTSEQLADWLGQHPDVQRVYYPKSSVQYQKLMNKEGGGGYGGLLSLLLHPHMCQRTFYDAFDVAKGPSLGTDFTLVCPYTLLAHYHELDFALQYQVPPNLLRIAVGLESFDTLQEKFQTALDACRLYPKVCMDEENGKNMARRSFSTRVT